MVLDFIMANQKKQQFLIEQIIENKVDKGEIQIVEKLVEIPAKDYSSSVIIQNSGSVTLKNEDSGDMLQMIKELQVWPPSLKSLKIE